MNAIERDKICLKFMGNSTGISVMFLHHPNTLTKNSSKRARDIKCKEMVKS